ncbi:MAG: hypothetical protein ACREVD_03925, partial [Burkholderiales bacterium]
LSGQLSTTSFTLQPITTTTLTTSTTLTAGTLVMADTRIATSGGTTAASLNDIGKTLQMGTTTTSLDTTTANQLLQQKIEYQAPAVSLRSTTTFTLAP